MRELKRSMARAQMKAAGIPHINKKGYYKGDDGEGAKPKSFFARNWRNWIFGKPVKKRSRA